MLWTAVMVGTKLGLLHLDDVLKGVMRTLAPSICTYQPASAVEPVLACFQVSPLRTTVWRFMLHMHGHVVCTICSQR